MSALARVDTRWVSVADAAERLDVTSGRIYHLIADGRLVAKVMPRERGDDHGRLHVRLTDVTAYHEYQRTLQTVRGLRAKLYPGHAG